MRIAQSFVTLTASLLGLWVIAGCANFEASDAAPQNLVGANKDAASAVDGAADSEVDGAPAVDAGIDAAAWTCTAVLSQPSIKLQNGATVAQDGSLSLQMKKGIALGMMPRAQLEFRPIAKGERFRLSGKVAASVPSPAGKYVYDASCSLVQSGWRWVPARFEGESSPATFSVHGFNYSSPEVTGYTGSDPMGFFDGVLTFASAGTKPLLFTSTIGITAVALDSVADAPSIDFPPAVVCGTSFFDGPPGGSLTVTFSEVEICTQKIL